MKKIKIAIKLLVLLGMTNAFSFLALAAETGHYWTGYNPKKGEKPNTANWMMHDIVDSIVSVDGEIATLDAGIAGSDTAWWKYDQAGLSASHGFTLNVRLKTMGSDPSSIVFSADGEQLLLLIGGSSGLELWLEDGGPPTQIATANTTTNDDFHNYRIVRHHQQVKIYKDADSNPLIDVNIDDNDFAGSANFVSFGRADERGHGQSELDYILWDNNSWKGYDPKSGEKPNSGNWTMHDLVDPITNIHGEIATLDAAVAHSDTGWWQYDNPELSANIGFTLDMRLKTVGSQPSSIALAADGEQMFLLIGGTPGLELWLEDGGPPTQIATANFVTDNKFHTYRITRYNQRVQIYVDTDPNALIDVQIDDNDFVGEESFIKFGRADYRGPGQSELDFILWRTDQALQQAPSPVYGLESRRVYLDLQEDLYGHLQGITLDDHGNLYWSFNHELIKSDYLGRILKRVPTNTSYYHGGDIEYGHGKIYVAASKNGWSNGIQPNTSEQNYIYAYNTDDLSANGSPTEVSEAIYIAGGIAMSDDGTTFIVVGGLPLGGIEATDLELEFAFLDQSESESLFDEMVSREHFNEFSYDPGIGVLSSHFIYSVDESDFQNDITLAFLNDSEKSNIYNFVKNFPVDHQTDYQAKYPNNYIFEYDSDLNPVDPAKKDIPTGWTHLGFQTATYAYGHWWFSAEGTESTKVLFKVDNDYNLVSEYTVDDIGLSPAEGMHFISENLLLIGTDNFGGPAYVEIFDIKTSF